MLAREVPLGARELVARTVAALRVAAVDVDIPLLLSM
jgi:hypothetical protein